MPWRSVNPMLPHPLEVSIPKIRWLDIFAFSIGFQGDEKKGRTLPNYFQKGSSVTRCVFIGIQ